jgi:hypothetical protein
VNKDFGVIFWVHFTLIVLIWLSPLWLSWDMMLIGILAIHLYWWIFEGCHLTHLEAGKDKDNTFYHYYLSKRFPRLNKRRVKIWVRYIIPVLLLALAYLLQETYNLKPLLWFQ